MTFFDVFRQKPTKLEEKYPSKGYVKRSIIKTRKVVPRRRRNYGKDKSFND